MTDINPLRGGSWLNGDPRNCRSAYRDDRHPNFRDSFIGFRLVCLPQEGDLQTLHTIALQMVDTLEQIHVLPEICDTLRRAIREPMGHLEQEADR